MFQNLAQLDAPVDLAAGLLKVRTFRGEYLWTVEGFSHLDTKTDVDSDEFVLLGHRWKLDLCPGFFNGEQTNNLAVFLWNRDVKPILVSFHLALVDKHGHPLAEYAPAQPCLFQTKGKSDPTSQAYSNYGTSTLAKRADILDSKRGFLENDTLRIRCVIERVEQVRTRTTLVPSPTQAMHAAVCDDMAKLLESGKHRCVALSRALMACVAAT